MNELVLKALLADARPKKKPPTVTGSVGLLKGAQSKVTSFSDRHRGTWFRPEYNFNEIEYVQDRESLFARAVKKKTDRFMLAGWEWYGPNPETVEYIKRRIAEMEIVTNQPFNTLIRETVSELNSKVNCMWVKVRSEDSSTGKVRTDLNGKQLQPVAGYFILPFARLEFKTKPSGEITRVKQVMVSRIKEFAASDIIHFFYNRKPGYVVGTPDVLSVMDDIALLRRIEENVEDLIETSLFPVYHYQIGTDDFPEVLNPVTGKPESETVKDRLEYMPSNSVYVSDHRHKITVLGSQGKALQMDYLLQYFYKRVLAGLGLSVLDVGEGDSANRSTAGALSKSLIQDVEALQEVMKTFLEHFMVSELLLEGGYDPLNEEDKVFIRFRKIDREEETLMENQAIQMMTNKLITVSEARNKIGAPAYREDQYEDTYFTKFEEPLALGKNIGAGSAASETLANLPHSNLTPEAVKAEKAYAEKQEVKKLAAKKAGSPGSRSASTGRARLSASQSRPSNQRGTRSAPKTSKDFEALEEVVKDRAKRFGVSEDTVRLSLSYRYAELEGDIEDVSP